jgi:prolyl-tRNA synthetase
MRYSEFFPKTTPKTSAPEEPSVNHDLLTRGGFVDRLMAGSYSFLPLGWRVHQKVEQIVREEMNQTGALEIRMPLLHPREIWDRTGRWDSASEVMYQARFGERDYALSFTHEELALDIVGKKVQSYRELPVKIYHFSTKFRQELRPRSGLLRGREFIMKDLYSAHASGDDLDRYYEEVRAAYLRAFSRMGIEAHVVEAGGGVFTDNYTHEFNAYSEVGESKVFYCEGCDFAQNDEIFLGKAGDPCPKCAGEVKETLAIELGNTFKFGTEYAEKMGVTFTDERGESKLVHLASYGIGTSRLVGALAELFHDDKGLLWPESVAPFRVVLSPVFGRAEKEVRAAAEKLYKTLQDGGIETLYDDRAESAGKKFADADLLGIPYRLTISEKTLSGDAVELKSRESGEVELLSQTALLERLNSTS